MRIYRFVGNSSFGVTPQDATVLFEHTDCVGNEQWRAIGSVNIYVKEFSMGGAITVGHQWDSGETEPKLSGIEECLIVKVICWVLVWHEQLRNVPFV